MRKLIQVIILATLSVGVIAEATVDVNSLLVDMLYEINVLAKNDNLMIDDLPSYRKRMLVDLEKYIRHGGKNYKWIAPSKLFLNATEKYLEQIEEAKPILESDYRGCISNIEYSSSTYYLGMKLCELKTRALVNSKIDLEQYEDSLKIINIILSSEAQTLTESEADKMVYDYVEEKKIKYEADRKLLEKELEEKKRRDEQEEKRLEQEKIISEEKVEFNVITIPNDARVRILNIKPVYQGGIKLVPGKYKIEVTRKGYKSYVRWVNVDKVNNNITIKLKKFSDEELENLKPHDEEGQREFDRYVEVIKLQMKRSWVCPPNAGSGLSSVVQMRLIPGGDVVPGSVITVKSSGNTPFDRSVENAVYKAAPLPVPNGDLFNSFRSLTIDFANTGW